MRFPIPLIYVNQSALIVLFAIPLISAFFGLRNVALKSVIHFQQGTLSVSPWNVAFALCFQALPPFAFWCISVGRGAESAFFVVGGGGALVLSLFVSLPILHYVPSPSILQYILQRFQSHKLLRVVSYFQMGLSFICSVILLLHSSSFIASITNYSVYLLTALLALFSVFAVVFSGQSTIMTPALLLNIMFISSGIGLFLYYGIEQVTSLSVLVPSSLSFSDSLISLIVGFLFTLHQLNASPVSYQMYFPLPTIHKLRLSYIFFGIFYMFFSIFVFLICVLFNAFMDKHCNLQYSYGSFFQFTKYSVAYSWQAYTVCASFLCLSLFCFQCSLLSLTSHLYEHELKQKLLKFSQMQQLCSLQMLVLVLATFISLACSVLRFFDFSYGFYTPAIVYSIITLSCICGAVYMCGYFIPCCNWKGALAGLAVAVLLSAGMFYINVHDDGWSSIENSCIRDNSTTVVQIKSFNMEKLIHLTSHFPLKMHCIFAFVTSLLVSVLVSWLTGGQDQMALDWNLVVFPFGSTLNSRSTYHSNRPFVDSQSFRFAQKSISPHMDLYR